MNISVLGCTGSIGEQTLAVAKERSYRITALGAGRNLKRLAELVHEYSPQLVGVHESIYAQAKELFSSDIRLVVDPCEIAAAQTDVVVNAMSGLVGLAPTRTALEHGQALALATKEAMVTAGHLMWEAAQRGNGRLVPIDSEHTGVYQCLLGESLTHVSEIILTASGGPFRDYQGDLNAVTPQQALQHPSWNMGAKVTIDSSTLWNKGLEVIECAALYGIPVQQVDVVIHPQSMMHAAIRLCDGSLKAQFGPADMRLPIAYAIEAAPTGMRYAGDIQSRTRAPFSAPWPLQGEWQFFPPDKQRFPCLDLAYEASKHGGIVPTTLNAADEIAVTAFLEGQIKYTDISRLLEHILHETPSETLTWQSLYQADEWARIRAREWVAVCSR